MITARDLRRLPAEEKALLEACARTAGFLVTLTDQKYGLPVQAIDMGVAMLMTVLKDVLQASKEETAQFSVSVFQDWAARQKRLKKLKTPQEIGAEIKAIVWPEPPGEQPNG